jgi:thiamine-monophosphate kinase
VASDEFDIIRRHFNRSELAFAARGVALAIGDDCALLQPSPGCELAVSMDMLVEGVHFLSDCDPFQLGQRTLLVNLSDLAAMGARPVCFTLALSLPRNDAQWLARFSAGTTAGRAGPLCLCVQVHGEVPAGAALRRSGARVGDAICVTGTLGDAAAGLRILRDAAWPALATPLREALVQSFQTPESRVAAGTALRGVASAAIDLSDGLASDLGHVLRASGVGARVDVASLPLSAALCAAVGPEQRLALALGGGDDYELCFTVPPQLLQTAQARLAALGTAVHRIGEIVAGSQLQWWREGRELALSVRGYNHFAGAGEPA